MIEATLFRSGNTYSIDVTGHAGYAPAGSDIICAAVSALVQSFAFYCRKTDGIKVLDDGKYGRIWRSKQARPGI